MNHRKAATTAWGPSREGRGWRRPSFVIDWAAVPVAVRGWQLVHRFRTVPPAAVAGAAGDRGRVCNRRGR